ncbi:syntaxin binding protein 1 [Kickxella alabastrina]|uniref:Syntaxin binding protein 1 n=1 Tax=Kickxella alabastrina TaxID=61397 RepID=A0ACC1I7L4_9FUNG|nr:syntaxin binding protein 1 [Kickxella alabastrina]
MISKKLANVCGALKENPVVRYLLLDQEIHGDTKARPLAFLFHTEMDRIREALPEDGAGDGRPPAELIIVDRSADPFAPVLHEFTYEAMVYDLLEIEDGNKFTYTVELANGAEDEKTVVLDDSDAIWQEFRFQHISDAQRGILAKFQGLVGSNRAIVDMQAGQKMDMRMMRDVVSTMPQFKDQLALISAHINMMEKCMDEFNKRCLNDLGLLEQNLVTGITVDGEKYSSGDVDIAEVLNNRKIKSRDKLRLLLLFFIANPSITEPERQKLAHLAKLNRECRETIRNMALVIRWSHALDLLKQIKKKPGQASKDSKASKWSLAGMRAGITDSQENEEEKPYDLSRYVPGLKSVLEGCVEGYLSEDLFPYVVPPERPRDSNLFSTTGSMRSTPGVAAANERSESPASSMWTTLANSVGLQTQTPKPSPAAQAANSADSRQIKSLRSARPTWQKRDSTPSATPAGGFGMPSASMAPSTPVSASAMSPTGMGGNQSRSRNHSGRPRIIMFVIGGVTHSEVRAANEIARKYDREVIVGSTHFLDPASYMRDVSSLAFELVEDDGRPANLKPSYIALGYGGPNHIDPLTTFDEELFKAKPKPKPVTESRSRRDDGRGRDRSDSGSSRRSRSGSRSHSAHRNGYPESFGKPPGESRSHLSAPPPQQHQGLARADAYSTSNSGNSMNDHMRREGSRGSMRSSVGRGTAEALPNNIASSRDYNGPGSGYPSRGEAFPSQSPGYRNSERPDRSERPERGERPDYRERPERGERPDYRERPERGERSERGERPERGEPQNFRAGYEEFRQQQQAAARSKSLHTSSSSSGYGARSSPQQQRPLPPQRQLSKEEVFRQKFEQSQNEWNAQKMSLSHINPDTVPDMHKVSLASASGRGRSGSSASATNDRKPTGFLKRYL